MIIAAIFIAIIAGFLALRFVTGLIKFAVLALIILAALYVITGGFGA